MEKRKSVQAPVQKKPQAKDGPKLPRKRMARTVSPVGSKRTVCSRDGLFVHLVEMLAVG